VRRPRSREWKRREGGGGGNFLIVVIISPQRGGVKGGVGCRTVKKEKRKVGLGWQGESKLASPGEEGGGFGWCVRSWAPKGGGGGWGGYRSFRKGGVSGGVFW